MGSIVLFRPDVSTTSHSQPPYDPNVNFTTIRPVSHELQNTWRGNNRQVLILVVVCHSHEVAYCYMWCLNVCGAAIAFSGSVLGNLSIVLSYYLCEQLFSWQKFVYKNVGSYVLGYKNNYCLVPANANQCVFWKKN